MLKHSRQRLDLPGTWDLAFDPTAAGVASGWVSGAWHRAPSEAVDVPGLWTDTHPDAVGIGFYRRVFDLPPGWAGGVVRLCFGGASYRLDAWLNGTPVGSHEGAYTPFWLDVSHVVRPAGNELVLRVAGLAKTEPVDGLLLQQCPTSKQSWYYIEAGLWGDVYLELLPACWCEAISVEPDLQGSAAVVDVELRNAVGEPRQAQLSLAVSDARGVTAAGADVAVSLLPGCTHHRLRLPLARPAAWSCDSPALYRAEAILAVPGAPSDSLTTTFGMRDFTVEAGQFLLNCQPIFLRGILLQPNYPVTLICPPDTDMMRREVQLAKDAGFNLIRTHLRPSPPGFLDLCDEMGMLVYAESSLAFIKDSPRLLEHGRRELEAMIGRDRNHPSVVFWGIFNENRQSTALAADHLTRYARALDRTRVIVDNSGGSLAVDQDFGWVDRATVIADRQTERQRIMDIHVYIGAPTPDAAYEWLRTLGAGGSAADMPRLSIGLPPVYEEFFRELRSYQGKIFVSELGCGGMSDLRDTVQRFGGRDLVDARELGIFCNGLQRGFKERHLERVFGSLDNLIAAAQEQQAIGDVRQIEAVLANRRTSGYCLTQLNDVAWEFHAGILDVWRRPKRVYQALQRVNRRRVLILKAASSLAACNTHLPLAVTLVDEVFSGEGEVLITVRDAGGAKHLPVTLRVPPGLGVKELGSVMVDTGALPGRVEVTARLMSDGLEATNEAHETIIVLPPVDTSPALRQVAWVGAPPAELMAAGQPEDATLLAVARPGSLTSADWQALLSAVEAGGVAIIGPLQPGDQAACTALANAGKRFAIEMGIGSWMGCYHWIPDSPMFAGLPCGGLAGEDYTSVLPHHVLTEQGGDVLAGSLRNTNSRFQSPDMLWFSDIEAVPHGRGHLLFCQYRIFAGKSDPLAARLFCNLVSVAQMYAAKPA